MKTIFTVDFDHAVDVITNSSSELFLLEGESKSIVESLIKEVYPQYEYEYNLYSISELDLDRFYTYLSYRGYSRVKDLSIGKFPADYLYSKPERDSWSDYRWLNSLSQSELHEIKLEFEQLNPKMFFLFSKDENPNFEMQDMLSNIAERWHLG